MLSQDPLSTPEPHQWSPLHGPPGLQSLLFQKGAICAPSLSRPLATLSSRSTLLLGWVGVLLRVRENLFLTPELRDFPTLQGNQGCERVPARCPRVSTQPLAIHPNRVGCIPLHLGVASKKEGGDSEVSLALQYGLQRSFDQGPLARPSLLTLKIPEASSHLSPLGIHSLSFPLPNYNEGGAGIQPGPQIPALGGALEYRLLSATRIPFGAGFLGGSPMPCSEKCSQVW